MLRFLPLALSLVSSSLAASGQDFGANVAELTAFIAEHGHSDVPRDYSDFSNWFAGVRRAGRTGRLSPERKNELIAIGATFKPLDGRWEEGLRLLTQFVERTGHARVPKEHLEEGVSLWAWLHQQRREAKANTLSKEKREKLAALGAMSESKEAAEKAFFEKRVEALAQYKAREGHLNVPREYVVGKIKLGLWLSKQKNQASSNKLDPQREKILRDLGVRLRESHAVRIGPSAYHHERQRRKERGKKYWKFLAGA